MKKENKDFIRTVICFTVGVILAWITYYLFF